MSVAPPLEPSFTTATPQRRKRSSEGRDAWLLVLPALLPVMLFSVYPLVHGVLLGFTDAKAGLNVETHANGLENYIAAGRQRPCSGTRSGSA